VIDSLVRDLRHAVRSLLGRPGFLLAAAGTLALGVGANTAMFSVVRAVLLEPLPFPGSERLVTFHFEDRVEGGGRIPLSVADFQDVVGQVEGLEHVSAYTDSFFTLTGDGEPEQVRGVWVTGGVFPALGVEPQLGRTFVEADDRAERPIDVVLSHELWQRRFGGDSAVIGRGVTVGGASRTVVGVMPPGFEFPLREAGGLAGRPQLWVRHPSDPPDRRGPYYLFGLGLLPADGSLGEARAELATVAARLAREHPETNSGRTLAAKPLKEAVVGPAEPTLLALFAATGLVLLIAAANVSNLLLLRGAGRAHEMAIRVAQGASPRRLLQQVLVESLVLAAFGSLLGATLAYGGLRLLPALAPADLPRLDQVAIDGGVLAFVAAVAALSALAFGALPARQGLRVDPYLALRERAAGPAAPGWLRARGALVAAEVALCFVVLVSTGLIVTSLLRLERVDAGVAAPEEVLSAQLSLPSARYGEPETLQAFYRQLGERLKAMPGVESSGLGISLPPSELAISDTFEVEGQPPVAPEDIPALPVVFADSGYFETLGIPLLRGRLFDSRDRADGPPVVLVNAAFAERYLPGEDAIGRRMKNGGPERPDNAWMEIVGVVSNVPYEGLHAPPKPAYYLPFSQGRWNYTYVLARAAGDPHGLAQELRAAVAELDPELAVTDVRTLDERIAASLGAPRFRSRLFLSFCLLALVLAAVGIYAVTASAVAERTREIGIRIALGAGKRTVVGEVVRRAMRPAVAGLAVGLLAALALTQTLQGLLYGLDPTDPATFTLAAAVLLASALLAAWLPARRAAGADPVVALRRE
jgi:putative ABC transport system permease protein